MTKKLNQSFPVGDTPFLAFREAPTSVELLIHNLPLSIVPDEPTDLFQSLLGSNSNAIDIAIFGARFTVRSREKVPEGHYLGGCSS